MPRMLLTGSGLCLALLANVKVHSRSLLYGRGHIGGGKQCEESRLALRDCLSSVSPGSCLGCSGGSQRTMQVQSPSLGKVNLASLFLGCTWLYFIPSVPSLFTLPGMSPSQGHGVANWVHSEPRAEWRYCCLRCLLCEDAEIKLNTEIGYFSRWSFRLMDATAIFSAEKRLVTFPLVMHSNGDSPLEYGFSV